MFKNDQKAPKYKPDCWKKLILDTSKWFLPCKKFFVMPCFCSKSKFLRMENRRSSWCPHFVFTSSFSKKKTKIYQLPETKLDLQSQICSWYSYMHLRKPKNISFSFLRYSLACSESCDYRGLEPSRSAID